MVKRYENYMILAHDFLMDENYLQALRAFERALKYSPTDKDRIECYYELADLYWAMESFDRASEMYVEILKISNRESGAHYGLGILSELLGASDEESLRHYQSAITLDPLYTQAYYYQGHLWYRMGDSFRAKECFKQCLTIEPGYFLAANDLGSIYEEEGRYEVAKRYFLKSLQAQPDYVRALYNMGVIEHRLGNIDTSMDYYRRGIETDPSFFRNYFNLSALYIEAGNLERGEFYLLEGIANCPPSVNLHYNLACIHAKRNEIKSAIASLDRAIEIDSRALEWARGDGDLKYIVRDYYDNNKN